MINVLINAYACSPNWGSEPGMAWNWISNLASYCNLFIITEGEWKEEIEKAVLAHPYKDHLHFYYNPLPEKVRKMCWNQGDWRFYWYYRKWQLKTSEMARKICMEHPIDILHQLNMIGFREPGYLWKIQDIPFVWGPIGGMELMPVGYLDGASLKQKAMTYLKNCLNNYQTRHSKRVHKAIEKADALVAAVKGVKEKIERYYHKDVVLINETGCKIKGYYEHVSKENEALKILWVGKFDFRKQLGIAIKTIAGLSDIKVELHIVGSGSETDTAYYKELAKNMGIDSMCRWYGIIKNDDVQKLMRESDLLLFTSIMEGTPHVVLEAISNCLPVLCLDTCGQSASVNERVGIKIALTSTRQSAIDFSSQIRLLYHDRNRLAEMSKACVERQHELSWENKAIQMINIYKAIIRGQKNG